MKLTAAHNHPSSPMKGMVASALLSFMLAFSGTAAASSPAGDAGSSGLPEGLTEAMIIAACAASMGMGGGDAGGGGGAAAGVGGALSALCNKMSGVPMAGIGGASEGIFSQLTQQFGQQIMQQLMQQLTSGGGGEGGGGGGNDYPGSVSDLPVIVTNPGLTTSGTTSTGSTTSTGTGSSSSGSGTGNTSSGGSTSGSTNTGGNTSYVNTKSNQSLERTVQALNQNFLSRNNLAQGNYIQAIYNPPDAQGVTGGIRLANGSTASDVGIRLGAYTTGGGVAATLTGGSAPDSAVLAQYEGHAMGIATEDFFTQGYNDAIAGWKRNPVLEGHELYEKGYESGLRVKKTQAKS